jgi:predicted transcriptional regulator
VTPPATTLRTAETEVPEAVETPRAKLVYIFLLGAGPASPEELSSALDVRKIDLYATLETLLDRGLVERVEAGYVVL